MRLVATIDGEQAIFRLKEGSWTMGRSKACELVVPTKAISRQHAQFYVDGNQVTIKDLGSSNGIYVNGNRVKIAVLNDGDVIGLGRNFEMTFDASATEPTAVKATRVAGESDEDAYAEVETHNEKAEARQEEVVDVEEERASSDDTPVDEQFAPVKYEPQAPAVGPQLVQRDGKWFLKDPDTGREVEIVPKWAADQGAGAAAAGEGALEPLAAKKRKMKLVIAASAAVVFVIILAGVLMRPPPDTGTLEYPKEQYNQAIDQGIDFLANNQFEEATKVFRTAHLKLPGRLVAGILKDLSVFLGDVEQKPETMDWERLERFLDELKNSVYSTPKVEMYAKQKAEWAQTEQQFEAILNRSIPRIKIQPEEAFADLKKIPSTSRCFAKAQPYVELARQACIEKYVVKAKRAEDNRNWDGAIISYQTAETFTLDGNQFDNVIRQCRQNILDQNRIKTATEALDEGRYEAVKPGLEKVLPSSPYYQEAESLLATADKKMAEQGREVARERARSLYKAGRGAEALELVKTENIAMDDAELEKITSVTKLTDQAERDLAAKKYEDARKGWEQVMQLETDDDNWYRKKAARNLKDLDDRRPEIGREYQKMAETAMAKGDYPAARNLFKMALSNNPDLGKSGLQAMDNLGRDWYVKGLTAEQNKRKQDAIDAYKKVLELVEPTEGRYIDARKRLMVLQED
jgi:tetratricopeptide (TPR) repeat protein